MEEKKPYTIKYITNEQYEEIITKCSTVIDGETVSYVDNLSDKDSNDMFDETVIDTLKEMAVKHSNDSYVYRVFVNAIRLIHRQKEEIERLTELQSRGSYRVAELGIQNAELQKQVDELKANQVIECYGILKGCDIVKQAVKDTAKEILQWLKAEVIMTEIPHGSEPCEEDVEAVMWWQIEEHFKKKYGVEVE